MDDPDLGAQRGPSPAPSSGRARSLRRAGLVLVGLVAALALGEVGQRLRLRFAGRPYSASGTADELRRLADPMGVFVPDGAAGVTGGPGSVGRFLHPFYASESRPDSGRVLASFRKGFDEGTYVVVVVGGSVAASWAGSVGQDFAERLEASPELAGRDVVVLNFAHAAYKQPQQVNRVAFLLALGYRPDAVVNLDGFNEVSAGITNALAGVHPVFPSGPVWRGVLASLQPFDGGQLDHLMALWTLREDLRGHVARTLRWRMHASALSGTVALGRARALSTEAVELQRELGRLRGSNERKGGVRRMYDGPPFKGDLDAVVATCVESWSSSSRMLNAICAEYGVRYLHVLQPALFYGGKPRVGGEREIPPGPDGWKLGPELAYDHLRAAGQELLADGVPFVDATEVFLAVEEAVFVDACHVNLRGNVLLEQRIGEALVEHLASADR